MAVDENPSCPECKGDSWKYGTRINRDGEIQKYKCIDCGRVFVDEEGEHEEEE